jgi:hypothetical protein
VWWGELWGRFYTTAPGRLRQSVEPKAIHSTVLTGARGDGRGVPSHTLLPLDDCLYALQPSIPHLTRSSLHRCLQRHGISRLPALEGEAAQRKRFKVYPIGYFHIDIAEVPTEEGKLSPYVGIDRTSKFAFVQLHDKADRPPAVAFLEALISTRSAKSNASNTASPSRTIPGPTGRSSG